MTATTAPQNGTAVEEGTRAAAIAHEAGIAERAAEIRGETVGLDQGLFLKLLPLLREPIPAGFIKSIGIVKGKPYDSTGITSVQVQIDRMDNVLTPLGWTDEVEYLEAGKVCRVRVAVIDRDGEELVARESHGGVNQASTLGNLHKGSYTNAAKVAFARIGPGHEVYVGVTDLDPDVHEGAAHAQATTDRNVVVEPPLGEDAQQKIRTAFTDAGISDDDFKLYLKAIGAESLEEITAAGAYKLRELLDAYLAKKANA